MQIVAPRIAQDAIGDPTSLPNLAAWFDALDVSTMLSGDGTTITDGGAVALWGDKSGNSGANCLVLPGVASNNATITAITAFGTGDFAVSMKIRHTSLAALQRIFGSASGGLLFTVNTDGSLVITKRGTGDNTATAAGKVTVFAECVIGYSRSSTTGTYYVNGVAVGTTTDSQDYTAGVSAIGSVTGGADPVFGNIKWARVYNAALDATAMAADAAGTVQANNVLSIDFSAAGKKLANGDTFTCATGQTVTLNSSGATGARIAGERDWFQGTAGSRGTFNLAGHYVSTDGTDDYYKTPLFSLPQPVTLYAVLEQTTWTSGDYLIDGSASDTLALIQTTTTPQINLSAGSSVAANTDLAVETRALVTIVSNGASSLVSINRLPATTGNAGAGVPNGLTLASKGTAGSYGNARYYEIAVYRAAHDQATRHRFALYAARKWGFAA